MSDGPNHVVRVIESGIPLLSLPGRYVWIGLTEGTWLSSSNFAFGYPLTMVSLGMIALATARLFEHPLEITSQRLSVSILAAVFWVVFYAAQALLQSEWRKARTSTARGIFVVYSDILGFFSYILFTEMLYTVA